MKIRFEKGEYITRIGKAPHPSLQTMRIETLGREAKCTTSIAGGCTVGDLSLYRKATDEEIKAFLRMESKAYE